MTLFQQETHHSTLAVHEKAFHKPNTISGTKSQHRNVGISNLCLKPATRKLWMECSKHKKLLPAQDTIVVEL
jgi:hypothetical protein